MNSISTPNDEWRHIAVHAVGVHFHKIEWSHRFIYSYVYLETYSVGKIIPGAGAVSILTIDCNDIRVATVGTLQNQQVHIVATTLGKSCLTYSTLYPYIYI